jgi:tetratricopeptide (TPR) repeat protein
LQLRLLLIGFLLFWISGTLCAQTSEQSTYLEKKIKECENTEKGGAATVQACKAVVASPDAGADEKTDAYGNLAEIYWNIGALDTALANLNAAIRLAPEECSGYIGRGLISLQRQQYDAAIREFSVADKLEPGGLCGIMESPRFLRGLAYFAQGNFTSAESDLTTALQLHHLPDPMLGTMLYLARLRNGKDGNQDLEHFVSLLRQNAENCKNKPHCIARWTPFEEAFTSFLLGSGSKEALFSASRDDDPETDSEQHSVVYFTLGELALVNRNNAEAQSYFQSAAALDWRAQGNILSRAELARLPSLARGVPHPGTVAPLLKAGHFYALVIGIQKYGPYPGALTTPDADADDISRVLFTQYNFQVQELKDKDAKRSAILTAITQYKKQLQPEDSLLIYYAGHGAYEHDKAYWLPVDVESDDSPNKIISDDLTASIRQLKAGHVLVISDSCYSGAMARNGATTLPPRRRPTSSCISIRSGRIRRER